MPKGTVARKTVPRSSKGASETRVIMARLATQHPNADTELHFSTAYELLVATILSAQCTDERVNKVTPALFRRYPNALELAKATTGDLEPQIQPTGFFRAKSRSLLGMATEVVKQHGGEVPKTMEALVALPGVGRKTANVVLGHALGIPGLPVDRHVLRVANRIGIARAEDPEVVERQLCAAMPPEDWTPASDTLILHGRRICRPRPLCEDCVVRDSCDYYRALLLAAGRKGRKAAVGAASTPAPEHARALKAEGTGRGGGGESTPTPEHARALKARGTGRGGGGESTPTPEHARALKARGTGRGGGAPRQLKK